MRILKTGIATIQDQGRYGYRSWGIPVGGGMDQLAMRLGNLLVGNEPDCACIEISRGAFSTSFTRTTLVALTGRGFEAYVNGRPIKFWQPFMVPAGTFLQLFPKEIGFTYISIHGGVKTPEYLGSRASLAGIPLGNRSIVRAGDILPTTLLPEDKGQRIQQFLQQPGATHQVRLGNSVIPDYDRTSIRFTAGAEYDWFTDEAKKLLETVGYTPTALSNRMGSRLNGPALTRVNQDQLISTAVLPGTMQVSPDGQILLLLADAQTTGGYPRIGQVIAADLHLAAQTAEGRQINFELVGFDQSQDLLLQQEKRLLTLAQDYYLYFS